MQQEFKISVIMPVYNAELYLKDAIQSILNQTIDDFELILINDGSTDSSESIIQKFKDTRIRYIKNEVNKGLVYTLNKGLDLAKGKYIARMDADDKSHPERFVKQVNFMESNPSVSLLGTAFVYMNTPYVISHPCDEEQIKVRLLKNTTFAHPSVMMRREDLIKYNLKYKEAYFLAEDYKLWTDFVLNGLKVANLPDVLLEYRQHDTQISTSKKEEQERVTTRIKKEYVESFFSSYLTTKAIDAFISDFKNISLSDSLKLSVEFSKVNNQNLFFDVGYFDTYLRELMYLSSPKASFIDILQSMSFLSKPKFVATFYSILVKNYRNGK